MHSSRMRTGRSLTVCCSLLPGEGGRGVCSGGGVCSWGGPPCWGGLLPGGSPCPEGGVPPCPEGGFLPARGGSPCPGGALPAWGGFPLCPGGSPYPETPPVNRITHTCKNNLGHNFVADGNKNAFQ